MESYTVSSRILTLHRAFAAYTSQRLQELGLNFGQMYFILYVGKHPDCTPSELTKELHLDWGHSQRSLVKLVEDGFLTREAGAQLPSAADPAGRTGLSGLSPGLCRLGRRGPERADGPGAAAAAGPPAKSSKKERVNRCTKRF